MHRSEGDAMSSEDRIFRIQAFALQAAVHVKNKIHLCFQFHPRGSPISLPICPPSSQYPHSGCYLGVLPIRDEGPFHMLRLPTDSLRHDS